MPRVLLAATAAVASLALVVACGASEGGESASAPEPAELAAGEVAPGEPPAEDGELLGSAYQEPEPSDEGADAGDTDAGTDAGSTSDAGSSSGGSSSGGSSGATPGACSLTRSGATGKETGGVIPVCCAPTTAQKTAIAELFQLLNAYRAEKGRPALAYDDALEAAVQGHCEHMRVHGFFDHFAPEASVKSPGARAGLCGTTATARTSRAANPRPPP